MNDTKWEELRLAMSAIAEQHPQFRIKDLGRAEPWPWDGEWFYHFRLRPYREIEWVDLRVRSETQRALIRERLHQIHVPGIETETGFRVFGWIAPGNAVDYIQPPEATDDAATQEQAHAMARAPQ
jgi:hypothetical protein